MPARAAFGVAPPASRPSAYRSISLGPIVAVNAHERSPAAAFWVEKSPLQGVILNALAPSRGLWTGRRSAGERVCPMAYFLYTLAHGSRTGEMIAVPGLFEDETR